MAERRILAVDIETIPQASWADQADQTVVCTGAMPALHPITAHVSAVNFGWLKGTEIETDVMTLADVMPSGSFADAEPTLLNAALERIAGAVGKSTLLVTFNGKEFDLPMLRTRAALLRLRIPALPWRKLLYPFDDRDHLDLRLLLSNSKRGAVGTLQTWATAFGIHAEERGEEVWSMVRAGKWSVVADYGHAEGRTLVELYRAVEGVL